MTGRKLLALVTPLVAVTLVLAAGMALAQESAYPQDHANLSTQQGSSWPPSCQMAMHEDLTTINYWEYLDPHSNVWNGYVLGNFSSSLFGLSAKRFDWIPVLAADFPSEQTQVGDFWVITVTLKPDVLWSDGTPFTADDMVFTLDTCADLELGQNWPHYCPDVLDHAEATGVLTVTYYFNEEVGLGVWQAGVSLAPILPKHYWGAHCRRSEDERGCCSLAVRPTTFLKMSLC